MSNLFKEIGSFFANGTPMTPGASWFLIGLLFATVILATLMIREIDIFVGLAIWNVKIAGLTSGVWHALLGREAYEIRKERVISVSKRPEYGFIAHTSDGERPGEYHIVVTDADDSLDYKEAKELSGDDKKLFESLLPPSRVRSYFRLFNKETGEIQEFFLMYLKHKNEAEVEEALNKYFEQKFYDELRLTRRFKKVA